MFKTNFSSAIFSHLLIRTGTSGFELNVSRSSSKAAKIQQSHRVVVEGALLCRRKCFDIFFPDPCSFPSYALRARIKTPILCPEEFTNESAYNVPSWRFVEIVVDVS